MKRFRLSLTLFFLSFFLVGATCSKVAPTKQESANQQTMAKEEKKVDKTLEEMEKNEKGKKIQTSTLAKGIQLTLEQVTNPPIQVDTAKKLNERIVSIVGSPHVDEINRIKATVELLNSAVEEERKKGLELLNQRDEIINKLQKEKAELNEKYDEQMWDWTEKSKEMAKEADAAKATLNSMSGFFGLNAVFWGIKKFFFSALTGIIIFGVIFLVLRILSMVNPAAGAAFSIFTMIGSSLLSLVKVLTPKAFEFSNYATRMDVNKFRDPLVKMVDVIQDLKERQKENPEKNYTIKDILSKFDRDMNDSDKDLIDEILTELKWKR